MTTSLTPELVRKADLYLDRRHHWFESLGTDYFEAFGANVAVSSQVRNLQQLVLATTRFTDIEDFVKNQMGRKSGGSKPWRDVGNSTLEQLKELRKKSEELTEKPDAEVTWRLKLHLARGWVRAVVSHYLYAKACAEMRDTHGGD